MYKATPEDFTRMTSEGWTLDAGLWVRPIHAMRKFASRDHVLQFMYEQADKRESDWHKQILLSIGLTNYEQEIAMDDGWMVSVRLGSIQPYGGRFGSFEELIDYVHKRASETSTLHQKAAIIIAKSKLKGVLYGHSKNQY